MSNEDWGFEWEDKDPERPERIDILIIDLAKQAIQSMGDVFRLGEETETIRDDYPEYNIIVWKL